MPQNGKVPTCIMINTGAMTGGVEYNYTHTLDTDEVFFVVTDLNGNEIGIDHCIPDPAFPRTKVLAQVYETVTGILINCIGYED